MISRLFLNNSKRKMLAPHALDIAVIISSLIALLRFIFVVILRISSSSCALVSGITNKSLHPKEGRIDRASEFALANLTPILHSAK